MIDATICLSDWPQAPEGNKRRAYNGGRVIDLGSGRLTPTRFPPFHCLSPWRWTLHRCWLVVHGIAHWEPVVGTVEASQERELAQQSQGGNEGWMVCGTGTARLILVVATGVARDACTQSGEHRPGVSEGRPSASGWRCWYDWRGSRQALSHIALLYAAAYLAGTATGSRMRWRNEKWLGLMGACMYCAFRLVEDEMNMVLAVGNEALCTLQEHNQTLGGCSVGLSSWASCQSFSSGHHFHHYHQSQLSSVILHCRVGDCLA